MARTFRGAVNVRETSNRIQLASKNPLAAFKSEQADVATFASLLRLSGNAKALSDGKRVHSHIRKTGLESNKFLGSLLLQMYVKCGALEQAHALFVKMKEPNVYSWNFIIGAYAKDEDGKRACELYEKMQWQGVLPDKVTFVYVLSACGSQEALAKGKQMHTHIISKRFESDIVLGTALVTMYGKCGSLIDARGTFDRMVERDVVSWNAMIAAYGQHGDSKAALQVFHMMMQEGIAPNRGTFASILEACAAQAAIAEGKLVHGQITCSGIESDVVVATALVNMYGKCGSLDEAREVFGKLLDRDVILWNTIIAAFALHGRCDDALQLFALMHDEGVIVDHVTFVSIIDACASRTALLEGKRMHTRIICHGFELEKVLVTAIVNMYGKCCNLEEAKGVFDKVHRRDVILWTAIIAAYAQHQRTKEALQLFDQMQKEGVIPDRVTFVSILPACASQAALIEGKHIHEQISRYGLQSDVQIGNALITMYNKCGSLEGARRVFDEMVQRDLVSWNSIIATYAQHGHGKEALLLYEKMEKESISPDGVTYVSVLSACSHSGLLEEGRHYWASMTEDYGMSPNLGHYGCMIDLLGRAGQLDEAENLIKNMQCGPTGVPWMTLLGACRNQIDVERGERAATQVFELDPNNASPYVMLSNIYTVAGRVDEAENVMNKLRDMVLRSQPMNRCHDG